MLFHIVITTALQATMLLAQAPEAETELTTAQESEPEATTPRELLADLERRPVRQPVLREGFELMLVLVHLDELHLDLRPQAEPVALAEQVDHVAVRIG